MLRQSNGNGFGAIPVLGKVTDATTRYLVGQSALRTCAVEHDRPADGIGAGRFARGVADRRGEHPGASPIASPEASPVAASCEPGTSKTSADIRKEVEEQFPIEQPGNTEGTYVTGSVGDLQSVNPYIVEEQTSLAVVGFIFDSLLGGDPNTGQPVPGGVTDYWELAPDCVTYTFHLRTDKVWQDGTDFTADDVAFSFEALADPALASPYTGQFLDAVASWKVIDADTIQVVSTGCAPTS